MPFKPLPLDVYDTETGEYIGERITPEQIQDWKEQVSQQHEFLQLQLFAQQWFERDREVFSSQFHQLLHTICGTLRGFASNQLFGDQLENFAGLLDAFRSTFIRELLSVLDAFFSLLLDESGSPGSSSWWHRVDPERPEKSLPADVSLVSHGVWTVSRWLQEKFSSYENFFGPHIVEFFHSTQEVILLEHVIIKSIEKIAHFLEVAPNKFKSLLPLKKVFQAIPDTIFSAPPIIKSILPQLKAKLKSRTVRQKIRRELKSKYIDQRYWQYVDSYLDGFFRIVDEATSPDDIKYVLEKPADVPYAGDLVLVNLIQKSLTEVLPELQYL